MDTLNRLNKSFSRNCEQIKPWYSFILLHHTLKSWCDRCGRHTIFSVPSLKCNIPYFYDSTFIFQNNSSLALHRTLKLQKKLSSRGEYISILQCSCHDNLCLHVFRFFFVSKFISLNFLVYFSSMLLIHVSHTCITAYARFEAFSSLSLLRANPTKCLKTLKNNS